MRVAVSSVHSGKHVCDFPIGTFYQAYAFARWLWRAGYIWEEDMYDVIAFLRSPEVADNIIVNNSVIMTVY